ncbi:20S proteasome subunit [Neoconidiobolus thromboides FSU 785]|nr:20S proteasome subunit [Neoconidiobolus thromboides FSU 785]
MGSVGTGYDFSASTYSPEGRIFQVEYATKAVENAETSIGIRFKDGIILAVQKLVQSKLLVPGTNRRIHSVDEHVGLASTGLYADGKHLVKRAREEARHYFDTYHSSVPGKIISDRIGNYVQAHTLYSSVRPFGASAILGLVDHNGPQLYMVEPSGIYWGYHGCATGKGHKVAKNELEKLSFENLTSKQAIKEAAKIILICHEDSKNKQLEIEMSWISPETNNQHQRVPEDLLNQAIEEAKVPLVLLLFQHANVL